MNVAAVLVAAGRGRRMGRSSGRQTGANGASGHDGDRGRPKQFLQLAGRPILAHTIDRFESTDSIGWIVIVAPPGEERTCEAEMIRPFGFRNYRII